MNIIESVFAVFTAIIDWFVTAISSVSGIFYGAAGLTFLGVLTLCALGIAIVLLLVNLVRSYLRFR